MGGYIHEQRPFVKIGPLRASKAVHKDLFYQRWLVAQPCEAPDPAKLLISQAVGSDLLDWVIDLIDRTLGCSCRSGIVALGYIL